MQCVIISDMTKNSRLILCKSLFQLCISAVWPAMMRLTFMWHYENVLYSLVILICLFIYVCTPYTNLRISDDFFESESSSQHKPLPFITSHSIVTSHPPMLKTEIHLGISVFPLKRKKIIDERITILKVSLKILRNIWYLRDCVFLTKSSVHKIVPRKIGTSQNGWNCFFFLPFFNNQESPAPLANRDSVQKPLS